MPTAADAQQKNNFKKEELYLRVIVWKNLQETTRAKYIVLSSNKLRQDYPSSPMRNLFSKAFQTF
jgi:hypothetical protein